MIDPWTSFLSPPVDGYTSPLELSGCAFLEGVSMTSFLFVAEAFCLLSDAGVSFFSFASAAKLSKALKARVAASIGKNPTVTRIFLLIGFSFWLDMCADSPARDS